MRADNSRHVIVAARRRAELTRQRALAALRRMDATGQRITFVTVAREAGVLRSWLYAQDDLRAQIERLRQRHPAAAAAPVPPVRQQASASSLLRRLGVATARIRDWKQTTSNSALHTPGRSANGGPPKCSAATAATTRQRRIRRKLLAVLNTHLTDPSQHCPHRIATGQSHDRKPGSR